MAVANCPDFPSLEGRALVVLRTFGINLSETPKIERCCSQVAPSIAAVRFVYEALIQSWGVGGLRKYRVREKPSNSDLPPWI